ncbi:hypothetical protein VOLCADRAFT_98536 [Volvox carteri f. nagariensis]|uniref:Wax synthase domain-containing protein n=1 Tax=Volvox carteri f. nagariensis TaxID=3068 RepID=D8UFL4_VOLCA|nr:uncharacterized protein VOLCADRAFT_98536 [Volvox carteri f. nagariensis]EFJ41478.1 hypothetical protein VOLCADRAFT_98536 [Volvox carteri f. nagariensis]|eukprot:XP_002957423.1 hypothetical protein VOLCADRAFT_98536 [Volvox carteri f. nagariensis]
MSMTDLPQRLLKLHGFILVALVYCVVVVRPLRPGLPRLLASVPAFLVFSLCPLLVKDSALLSSAVALTTTWVANFKLLSYSGGRGALSHPGIRSGLQWGALLLLPFFPAKSGRTPASTSSRGLLLGLLLKLGVYLGLTAVLVGVELSALARHLIYAVHFWMFVSLCLDAAMPLGSQLLPGIPLQPAMDAPYIATSVREFWGRRYNQIVSATLLETVYKPIVEGRFACGGRLEGSFRMLGFFLLQPVIILAQDGASTAMAKWVPEQLSGSLAARALQTGVTLALVLGSAEWFWAPVESCGADKRALAEVDSAMRWLLARTRSPELLAR